MSLIYKDTAARFSVYVVTCLKVGLFMSLRIRRGQDTNSMEIRFRTHSIVFPENSYNIIVHNDCVCDNDRLILIYR